jgi:hypothetical protein
MRRGRAADADALPFSPPHTLIESQLIEAENRQPAHAPGTLWIQAPHDASPS